MEAVLADGPRTSVLPDVRLLVSELVTNAVRHGRGCDGGVELALQVEDGCVRVEVVDGGGGFVPRPRDPDPASMGGWGLVVVDRLADRWGVEGAGGTRVWFEMNV